MPKSTFLKLGENKRETVINAFLMEFSRQSYDDASISQVVKSIGISKGSIYQYFDDKLDLFMYLIKVCSEKKTAYFKDLKRDDFEDFWSYYRQLYVRGIQFDKENSLQSHFMHNLVANLNSPSVKVFYQKMMKLSIDGFESMIKYEINLGLFRKDLPLRTMSFMLYKAGIAIQEHMQVFGYIDIKKSIKNNLPVYHGKEKKLMAVVDDYLELLKKAYTI